MTDYGDEFQLLVEKAHPDLQAKVQGHLALCHYLDKLKSPLIAVSVEQSHPTTKAEAVEIIMQLESYLPKQSPTWQPTESTLLTTIQSTQAKILEQIQHLMTHVKQLENSAKESFK